MFRRVRPAQSLSQPLADISSERYILHLHYVDLGSDAEEYRARTLRRVDITLHCQWRRKKEVAASLTEVEKTVRSVRTAGWLAGLGAGRLTEIIYLMPQLLGAARNV